MDRAYSENDAVFKGGSPEIAANEYLQEGFEREENKAEERLISLLAKARDTGKWQFAKEYNVYLGFLKEGEEYLVVKKQFYYPRNLVAVLFDLLTTPPEDGGPQSIKDVYNLIDRYLGVIENRESYELDEEKKELKDLASQLYETLEIIEEKELTDKELALVSEEISERFFEPLADILEGILVDIAGN